jgi:hypothetical protein
MGEGLEERIAKNNLIFRAANETIRAKADEYNAPLERIPFLCECPVLDCRELVLLTLAEYKGVRADPAHFLTASGHEEPEKPLGTIVSREDGYVIVEKDVESLGDARER